MIGNPSWSNSFSVTWWRHGEIGRVLARDPNRPGHAVVISQNQWDLVGFIGRKVLENGFGGKGLKKRRIQVNGAHFLMASLNFFMRFVEIDSLRKSEFLMIGKNRFSEFFQLCPAT